MIRNLLYENFPFHSSVLGLEGFHEHTFKFAAQICVGKNEKRKIKTKNGANFNVMPP